MSSDEPPEMEAMECGAEDERYEFSAHAQYVMKERGILTQWVAAVLRAPERVEEDKTDSDLRHALRRIAERDNRVLRVVYNMTSMPWRIVTAYFDRGQRGML